MSDLISRQSVIDTLIPLPGIGRRVIDKIEEIPAAQTQRMKGKWEPFDIPWYQCSECGAVRENKSFMEHYCPNCGAKMEGASNEGD